MPGGRCTAPPASDRRDGPSDSASNLESYNGPAVAVR